jgi:serine/threonine-protein kinase
MLREEEALRQFRAEAAILRALAGRGAPRFVREGVDGRGPFLEMERIAHPTLGAHLHTSPGATWVARAARAAFEALSRVQEAADADGPLGIVHGDISPSNVAIAHGGDVAVLLDFGLASGRAWPRAAGGPFRGTARYAAPEAARSEPFDGRADVFALAASLLHAVAGEPPRAATSLGAAIAEAAEAPIDAWAERAARSLPPNVAAVLVRCVAFEAGARPRTAAEALAMW